MALDRLQRWRETLSMPMLSEVHQWRIRRIMLSFLSSFRLNSYLYDICRVLTILLQVTPSHRVKRRQTIFAPSTRNGWACCRQNCASLNIRDWNIWNCFEIIRTLKSSWRTASTSLRSWKSRRWIWAMCSDPMLCVAFVSLYYQNVIVLLLSFIDTLLVYRSWDKMDE